MRGGQGGPGGPEGSGGFGAPGGAGAEVKTDFTDPVKAVDSFLSAVKARNIDKIAESVANRAKADASSAKAKEMFNSIHERTLSDDDMAELADDLKDFKVQGMKPASSTGSREVLLSKRIQDEKTKRSYNLSRSVRVRKEKDEWKILDIGRISKMPAYR